MNADPADLAIVDSQIGTMGGIAVALDLRLEADAGRLEPRPVLLVLDRRPDVFMARRSGAEGWILKPLDPIRLRKAVAALLGGGTWHDTSFLPDPVAVPFRLECPYPNNVRDRIGPLCGPTWQPPFATAASIRWRWSRRACGASRPTTAPLNAVTALRPTWPWRKRPRHPARGRWPVCRSWSRTWSAAGAW